MTDPMTLAALKALADEEFKWAVGLGNTLLKAGADCPEPLARFLAFLPKALDAEVPVGDSAGVAERANNAAAAADAMAARVKALQDVLDAVRAGLGAQAGEETVAAVQRVAGSAAGVPALNVIRALVGAFPSEETASAVRRALSNATTAARAEAERALLNCSDMLAGVAKSVAEGRPWKAPDGVFVAELPSPVSVASGLQEPAKIEKKAIPLSHGLVLALLAAPRSRCVFSEPKQGQWFVQTITADRSLGEPCAAHEGKWFSDIWEAEGAPYCPGGPGMMPIHDIAPHWSKAPQKAAATFAEVTGATKPAEVATRVQTVIPGTVPEAPVVMVPALSTWEPTDAILVATIEPLTKAAASVGRPAVTIEIVRELLARFKAEKGSAPMPKRPESAFFMWAAKEVKK